MRLTRELAIKHAKSDLAKRLGVDVNDVTVRDVRERDFPDMSLGAPSADEMAAQMISSGWEIDLDAAGKTYQYRADKYQLRLHNFNGENYVIGS